MLMTLIFNMQGCKRTFKKFTVYRNHVYAFHDTYSLFQDDAESCASVMTTSADFEPVDDDGSDINEDIDEDISDTPFPHSKYMFYYI